mgnify:CR=1 FL=1
MNAHDAKIKELVKQHQGFVKMLSVKLAPFPGVCDDIAQQVFLEFINKKDRWDLNNDIKPLLAGITRNIALRYWRELKKNMSPELAKLAEHIKTVAGSREDSAEEQKEEQKKRALRFCLRKLQAKSRKLIEVYYYLDLTSIEIAKKMSMTADAVRRALFRLRKKLKKCIQRSLQGRDYV